MRNCKKCGNQFEGVAQKRFCSKECLINYKNDNRRKSPQFFNCLICGTEFLQKRKDNITCSEVCGRKLWVKNNPEKSAKCDKGINSHNRRVKWREKNRDKVRAIKQRYKAKRRIKDINFKLNELIGNAVRSCIKTKCFKKWSVILGYDVNVLKTHLEKTLPKEITWSDYLKGGYHIDHIIPITAYKFENYNDAEFKKCWNYRNLRVIKEKENLEKLASIQPELIKKYKIEDLLPEGLII